MDDMLALYNAFCEYKKLTSHDKDADGLRSAFLNAASDGDLLETLRTYPDINEDWVEKIETEMVYVERAVRENRQFIREDGEVVPIEKAKRVSRESVRHLARHSENIKEEPPTPDDILKPENIYIEEKLSDYAVYENRFLYMLLCYTRDFINIRYNKIMELGRTYKSELEIRKNLNYGKRTVSYVTSMHEVSTDSESAPEFAFCQPLIKRIEEQQFMVVALLATPLMQELAKVPMLKPPVTRTNVLKSNNNFKHALDLYHYLSSYEGAGYDIKENRTRFAPLPDKMIHDAAEIGVLQSFLAFQYGNKLSSVFSEKQKDEERRRKAEKEEALRRHIAEVRAEYEASGKGLEDYITLLEEHNSELEYAKKQYEIISAEKAFYDAEKEKLSNDIRMLEAALGEREQEMRKQAAKFAEDTKNLSDRFIKEAEALSISHRETVEKINRDHALAMNSERERSRADLKKEVDEKNALSIELKNANEKIESQRKDIEMMHARLMALCQKYGEFEYEVDYTSEKGFAQLEGEFEAFAEFFFGQWAKTKKRIRHELLYVLPEKSKAADDANGMDSRSISDKLKERVKKKGKSEKIEKDGNNVSEKEDRKK